jgi:hypothetical protein
MALCPAVLVLDAPESKAGDDGKDPVQEEVHTDQVSKQDDCAGERLDHEQDGKDDREQAHEKEQPPVRVGLFSEGNGNIHQADDEQDNSNDYCQECTKDLRGDDSDCSYNKTENCQQQQPQGTTVLRGTHQGRDQGQDCEHQDQDPEEHYQYRRSEFWEYKYQDAKDEREQPDEHIGAPLDIADRLFIHDNISHMFT